MRTVLAFATVALALAVAFMAWWGTCAAYGAWSRTWKDQKAADAFVLPVAFLSIFLAVMAFRMIIGMRSRSKDL